MTIHSKTSHTRFHVVFLILVSLKSSNIGTIISLYPAISFLMYQIINPSHNAKIQVIIGKKMVIILKT